MRYHGWTRPERWAGHHEAVIEDRRGGRSRARLAARVGAVTAGALLAGSGGYALGKNGPAAAPPAASRTVAVEILGTQVIELAGLAPSRLDVQDAEVVLTTRDGQVRDSAVTLPWERTLTGHAGDEVTVSVGSRQATFLYCAIKVDGREVSRQEVDGGTVTCRAQL